MESILISIRPEWCSLIVQGKKTLEVRKTRPKIETPFRCYIYCTKALKYGWFWLDSPNIRRDGVVIGEFVCSQIEFVDSLYLAFRHSLPKRYTEQCHMTYDQLHHYVHDDAAYFWHISDLQIYDKPKKLSQFIGVKTVRDGFDVRLLERPPQSWCYVEEA